MQSNYYTSVEWVISYLTADNWIKSEDDLKKPSVVSYLKSTVTEYDVPEVVYNYIKGLE